VVGPGVGVGVDIHGEGIRLAPPTRASPQPTSRRVTKRFMRPSAAGAISNTRSTCVPPTTAAKTAARGEPSSQFAESIIVGVTEHRNILGLPRQVPLSAPMAAPCYRTRPWRRLLGRPSLHGIVAGLPAPPPAVVPAWPPHASGYRVALDEGDWWAYRGRDTRVERAYRPRITRMPSGSRAPRRRSRRGLSDHLDHPPRRPRCRSPS
jgi:hypothetical protein